jgi:hypothetical protein
MADFLQTKVNSLYFKEGLIGALISLIIFLAVPVYLFIISIDEIREAGSLEVDTLPVSYALVYLYFLWWLLPILSIFMTWYLIKDSKGQYAKRSKYLISNIVLSVLTTCIALLTGFILMVTINNS